MILYTDIEQTLRKTHHMTSIVIKTMDGQKTVYLTQVKERIWARAQSDNQDTLIFPTSRVQILKIGAHQVEMKAAYSQRRRDWKEIEKQQRKSDLKQRHKALAHIARRDSKHY